MKRALSALMRWLGPSVPDGWPAGWWVETSPGGAGWLVLFRGESRLYEYGREMVRRPSQVPAAIERLRRAAWRIVLIDDATRKALAATESCGRSERPTPRR